MSALLRAGALVAFACLLVVRAYTPPSPVPASAPATEFSAERAQRHVRAIAERPHPIGSADAGRVRHYLVGELTALGITPDSQEATAVGTRYQALGHVRNIVARMPGTTPGGPAVMLMSHYDGVPAGPAASDAGSGVSVILETLRALRAGPPLAHDVIVLFTDGEEAGLLGAAAFVREHPWAKDVAVTMNFEARGTSGRAAMFETGTGNLDLVRLLRSAPDVSASSLTVTVYRLLPNDTDLSEVSQLGKPALNYAFVDRVDRYHTTQDDLAHQNPGSLQHEGAQAVVLARALGNGPLPRPVTGDAIFSDVPLLGVIYYPETAARPLAAVLVILLLIVLWRVSRSELHWIRDLLIGAVITVVAVALAGVSVFGAGALATRIHASVSGNPSFSGLYASAFASLALAVTYACWTFVRRWASAEGAYAGVLVLWTAIGVYLSLQMPGASFLFVWPLLAVLIASAVQAAGAVREWARWIAALIAMTVMVPIIALFGPVLLGSIGTGGIATAVLVSLLAALMVPQFEAIAGERRGRVSTAIALEAGLLFAIGALTVRPSIDHPTSSLLAYAIDVDTTSTDAWLMAPASIAPPRSWAADILSAGGGDSSTAGTVPGWRGSAFGRQSRLATRKVPRVTVAGPTAAVESDSQLPDRRRIRVRVLSPSGTLATRIDANDAQVLQASVDGRVIDGARYRRPDTHWDYQFNAPPDSGFVLAFDVRKDGPPLVLDLTAMRAGLPTIPGVQIPARPASTIPVQMGDITLVRRRTQF